MQTSSIERNLPNETECIPYAVCTPLTTPNASVQHASYMTSIANSKFSPSPSGFKISRCEVFGYFLPVSSSYVLGPRLRTATHTQCVAANIYRGCAIGLVDGVFGVDVVVVVIVLPVLYAVRLYVWPQLIRLRAAILNKYPVSETSSNGMSVCVCVSLGRLLDIV